MLPLMEFGIFGFLDCWIGDVLIWDFWMLALLHVCECLNAESVAFWSFGLLRVFISGFKISGLGIIAFGESSSSRFLSFECIGGV